MSCQQTQWGYRPLRRCAATAFDARLRAITIRIVLDERIEAYWGLFYVGPRPRHFSLEQNFPNPFNHSTVIRYHLAVPSQLRLDVFDLAGQKVRSLLHAQVARWLLSAILGRQE